ncbi:MAG: hypothetical protein EXR99_14405 [Gemmataceae bacterium]|nr:hypothetical protein [Gemmataceae bacterium]
MRTLGILAGLLLIALTSWAEPLEGGFKAGLASVPITPEKDMWMSGYAARTKPSEGKVHDLYAKALVVEDSAGKRALLISLDLVGIDRETSIAIKKEITRQTGISPEAIALACSHTHCGPVVGHNLRTMYFLEAAENAKVDEYTHALPGKVASVAKSALAHLQPCKLSWAEGKAAFAINRRNNKEADVPKAKEEGKLKGPVDHAAPVLAIHNEKGALAGIVAGYACHATTLSFQQWSGDYPGFAMQELEKRHPHTVAMFWAGCGADQNPIPRRSLELAKDYGNQLADAVDAVLKKEMKPIAGNLVLAYREIPLAFAELPNREKLVKNSTSANKYEVARAKYLLEMLKSQGSLPASYPYPIQTWKLGNAPPWVFLGGEVVVDYSLRVKKELGASSWVCGYANDVMAYIPSLRVLKEGGYEGGGSMVYYGRPAHWSPAVEDKILEEIHAQFGKRGATAP